MSIEERYAAAAEKLITGKHREAARTIDSVLAELGREQQSQRPPTHSFTLFDALTIGISAYRLSGDEAEASRKLAVARDIASLRKERRSLEALAYYDSSIPPAYPLPLHHPSPRGDAPFGIKALYAHDLEAYLAGYARELSKDERKARIKPAARPDISGCLPERISALHAYSSALQDRRSALRRHQQLQEYAGAKQRDPRFWDRFRHNAPQSPINPLRAHYLAVNGSGDERIKAVQAFAQERHQVLSYTAQTLSAGNYPLCLLAQWLPSELDALARSAKERRSWYASQVVVGLAQEFIGIAQEGKARRVFAPYELDEVALALERLTFIRDALSMRVKPLPIADTLKSIERTWPTYQALPHDYGAMVVSNRPKGS